MIKKNVLPTIFAKMLGSSCGLYIPDKDMADDIDEYNEKRERLITFQQMAVATDFDTALQAYYEFDLSDHQLLQLKIIFESTTSWLMGHVAQSLIESLDSGLASGRDKKEITEILLSQFIKKTGNNAMGKSGILVSLGYIPEIGQFKPLITPDEEEIKEENK